MKLNRKGFTLIELLAVITIMGILMLVAIPAVSRTIENSRRDTFADVAKEYVNTVRNAVLADELTCGDIGSVGATGDGTYYYKLDSNQDGTKDIMESGGLSSWSNARVKGYVQWVKNTTAATETSEQKVKTEYSVYLVDAGKHGIDTLTKETDISRSKVKTKTDKAASDKEEDALAYPTGTECTLK